jgi:hypothetical protein
MKFLEFLLASILFTPLALAARASISPNHVAHAAERPITSAKLCFTPVDAAEIPARFPIGTIHVVPDAVCFTVSNGFIQSGHNLAPSTSGTRCHIWAANRTTGAVIRDYGMTSLTGSNWTFNTFHHNLAVLPVGAIQTGAVTPLAQRASPSVAIIGTNPALLNLGLPIDPTGPPGTATNLASPGPIGATTPSTRAFTTVAATAAVPTTSPYADIRAYGAVIDGTTPIDTALASALASQCGTSGASPCYIYLPCGGVGCYLGNGSIFNNTVLNRTLNIHLQGTLKLGSTFVQMDNSSIIGDGGGSPVQFQNAGPVASISPPNVNGTAGTAISSTNAPVTFTPTFTTGTIANMPVGSAIVFAGTITCPATAARIGTGPLQTSYTTTGQCRIPAGAVMTVTGCSDTTFNVTNALVQAVDWPGGTSGDSILYILNTSSNSTATGCSITGFNADSYDPVRITAVSGSTVTATFNHTHASTDRWGMIAVTNQFNTFSHHDLTNISILGGPGLAYWGENGAGFNFENDGFQASTMMTSGAIELDGAFLGQITNSAVVTSQLKNVNCPGGQRCIVQPSYQPGLRCSSLPMSLGNNGVGCSLMTLRNTFVLGGILVDNDGLNTDCCATPPFLDNVTFEQPLNAAITFDNRHLPTMTRVTARDIWLQDNFIGNNPPFLAYTDNLPLDAYADLGQLWLAFGHDGTIANKYYTGRWSAKNIIGMGIGTGTSGPPGTFDDGVATQTEIRGIGAGMGPNLIPYATTTMAAAGSLSCAGSCTVTTNVTAPDLTSGAVELLSTANSGGYANGGNRSGTTAAGDYILYGAWVRPGTNQTILGSAAGQNVAMSLLTSDTIADSPQTYGMSLKGDWWHPQVVLTEIIVGSSTSHNISLLMRSALTKGAGNQFYGWFMIYIPASAGIPASELQRWRQDLMHGFVPSGMPAGVLAMNPALKLYWGSDTNLYRKAAGVLGTDQAFDATSGYRINGNQVIPSTVTGSNGDSSGTQVPLATTWSAGSTPTLICHDSGGNITDAGCPLTTGNLTDWTNSGVVNGYVPTWNSSTSKWIPGAQAGGGTGTCGFLNGCVELIMASDDGGFSGIGGATSPIGSCTQATVAITATSPLMVQCTGVTKSWVAGWIPGNVTSRFYAGRQPKITFLAGYKTAADYTTNARIQLGFIGSSCNVATMNASDTPACSYAIIRSSTSASDSTYKCVTDNGSGTPTVTAIGIAPTTAATVFSVSFGAGSVTCTVGITSVTNRTKIPASTTLMYDAFSDSGLLSNAVHLQLGGVLGVSQNGNF